MTRHEAQHYFDMVVGGSGLTVKELKDDRRLAHIIVHGCGRFPDEVEDEDAFFDQILDMLDVNDDAAWTREMQEQVDACDIDIEETLKEHLRTPYKPRRHE